MIHASCAFASIAGFALRGYWKLTDNPPLESNWIIAKIIALLAYIGPGMVTLRFGKSRIPAVYLLVAWRVPVLYTPGSERL